MHYLNLEGRSDFEEESLKKIILQDPGFAQPYVVLALVHWQMASMIYVLPESQLRFSDFRVASKTVRFRLNQPAAGGFSNLTRESGRQEYRTIHPPAAFW